MKILVIPDLHIPYEHPDSLSFIQLVAKKYRPDRVVFLGDELDYHAISFHDKDPDAPFSPSQELEESIKRIARWYECFPKADILESNHGSLVYRKGKFHGLPRAVFREYKDILGTPSWVWHNSLLLDDIHFVHQFNGNPANLGKDIVTAHHHSKFQIITTTSEYRSFFVAYAGSLIDWNSFAFAYQNLNIVKPSLGCIFIEDRIPRLIPMKRKPDGRWIGKL